MFGVVALNGNEAAAEEEEEEATETPLFVLSCCRLSLFVGNSSCNIWSLTSMERMVPAREASSLSRIACDEEEEASNTAAALSDREARREEEVEEGGRTNEERLEDALPKSSDRDGCVRVGVTGAPGETAAGAAKAAGLRSNSRRGCSVDVSLPTAVVSASSLPENKAWSRCWCAFGAADAATRADGGSAGAAGVGGADSL
jgi:hypothetical protein